jgi:beta-lactamase superfamily II metal-dependent hydrolase
VLATEIPGAFFYVPAPSWVSVIIYYFVLIVVLSGWLKTTRRKISGVFILICIAGIYFWLWEKSRDETELTVLPLNGGHAIFIDAAGRKNDWLVNCGDENAVEFTLKPFLRAQGVNTIPRLVLTEGDLRNIGGAESLNELFGIGELWTSAVHFRSGKYKEIVSEFEKPPARHMIFNFGGKTSCWQILWPTATNTASRADNNALVLLGNFSGKRILLLSDLGRDGQSELLGQTNDLHADIVVAGLPNEGEPLCDALLKTVQPKIIVIADSTFPANRRASRQLKERLEQAKIPVIYTRVSGAVKITMDKALWKLEAMDGQNFNSWTLTNLPTQTSPAE